MLFRSLIPSPGGPLTRSCLVLGPFPKDWLGHFQDRALQLERGIEVAGALNAALGTRAQLVAKPGGRPFAFFLPFPAGGAAPALPVLFARDILVAWGLPRLGPTLGLFETDLALECLEVLGDKCVRDPLRAAGAQPPAGQGHA